MVVPHACDSPHLDSSPSSAALDCLSSLLASRDLRRYSWKCRRFDTTCARHECRRHRWGRSVLVLRSWQKKARLAEISSCYQYESGLSGIPPNPAVDIRHTLCNIKGGDHEGHMRMKYKYRMPTARSKVRFEFIPEDYKQQESPSSPPLPPPTAPPSLLSQHSHTSHPTMYGTHTPDPPFPST